MIVTTKTYDAKTRPTVRFSAAAHACAFRLHATVRAINLHRDAAV